MKSSTIAHCVTSIIIGKVTKVKTDGSVNWMVS